MKTAMIYTTYAWAALTPAIGTVLVVINIAGHRYIGGRYYFLGDVSRPGLSLGEVVIEAFFRGLLGVICFPTAPFAMAMAAMWILYSLRKDN